jgi:hypothetical protein
MSSGGEQSTPGHSQSSFLPVAAAIVTDQYDHQPQKISFESYQCKEPDPERSVCRPMMICGWNLCPHSDPLNKYKHLNIAERSYRRRDSSLTKLRHRGADKAEKSPIEWI